jgi:hypothetical protein
MQKAEPRVRGLSYQALRDFVSNFQLRADVSLRSIGQLQIIYSLGLPRLKLGVI